VIQHWQYHGFYFILNEWEHNVTVALSVYLWGNLFPKKKILINSDNKAVVEILNSKTSKSVRVMSLVRYIVYWSILGNNWYSQRWWEVFRWHYREPTYYNKQFPIIWYWYLCMQSHKCLWNSNKSYFHSNIYT
jgi:hypothetical protein